jgi:hypothetical protein
MRTNNKTKRVAIGLAICVVALACLAISGRGSRPPQEPTGQKPGNDDAIALREALKRGGLRAAAKLKGHYVAEYNPHWEWGKFDVETLTKNSAAVVVGRVTKKGDGRLLEGQVIFTDYEVAVEEVVKGDIKQAAPIILTVPGGRIDFEDGTSAEQTTPSFEHPRIGHTYTFFLMEEPAVPSVFFLLGGPQGMFDIEDSSGVKSHGRPDDPAAVETKGENREVFMKAVREEARKWPKPGKCCGE